MYTTDQTLYNDAITLTERLTDIYSYHDIRSSYYFEQEHLGCQQCIVIMNNVFSVDL